MKRWIGIMASLLLLSYAYQAKGVTWTIEKVTNNTEDDELPSLTTDPAGVHIVYNHNDGDEEVFYATNASGVWQTHRVTDNTRNDWGGDIAVRGGDIHIAIMWKDTPDYEISYCKGKPGSWNIVRVTDDSDDDEWPSMVIDKDGYAHMAYTKNYDIFYANNKTGSWVEEQVTDNGRNDGYPSLALDKSGNPHIVFVGTPNAIFYIKKEAGVWKEEKIVDVTVWGTSMVYSNLVVDKAGFAHLAYFNFDGTDNEIYYANNTTGSWQESKVTSNDYNDFSPTLALDPQGKVHIAYGAATPSGPEIFYANNVTGVWNIGRVTDNSVNDGVAYLRRYLAFDNKGFGHITFFNNEDGDYEIYHARSNEPLFTGIEEREITDSGPHMYIYPNPSKGFSVIRFQLPVKGKGNIEIYDATGRWVRTFKIEPGSQRVLWDRGNLPSGIYFCRLTIGGFSITQKVILR